MYTHPYRAKLRYIIIKNHPSVNGNNPVALTLRLYYLATKNFAIETSLENVYKIAVIIAESDPSMSDGIVQNLAAVINDFKTPFKKWLISVRISFGLRVSSNPKGTLI